MNQANFEFNKIFFADDFCDSYQKDIAWDIHCIETESIITIWKKASDIAEYINSNQCLVFLVGNDGSGKTSTLMHTYREIERTYKCDVYYIDLLDYENSINTDFSLDSLIKEGAFTGNKKVFLIDNFSEVDECKYVLILRAVDKFIVRNQNTSFLIASSFFPSSKFSVFINQYKVAYIQTLRIFDLLGDLKNTNYNFLEEVIYAHERILESAMNPLLWNIFLQDTKDKNFDLNSIVNYWSESRNPLVIKRDFLCGSASQHRFSPLLYLLYQKPYSFDIKKIFLSGSELLNSKYFQLFKSASLFLLLILSLLFIGHIDVNSSTYAVSKEIGYWLITIMSSFTSFCWEIILENWWITLPVVMLTSIPFLTTSYSVVYRDCAEIARVLKWTQFKKTQVMCVGFVRMTIYIVSLLIAVAIETAIASSIFIFLMSGNYWNDIWIEGFPPLTFILILLSKLFKMGVRAALMITLTQFLIRLLRGSKRFYSDLGSFLQFSAYSFLLVIAVFLLSFLVAWPSISFFAVSVIGVLYFSYKKFFQEMLMVNFSPFELRDKKSFLLALAIFTPVGFLLNSLVLNSSISYIIDLFSFLLLIITFIFSEKIFEASVLKPRASNFFLMLFVGGLTVAYFVNGLISIYLFLFLALLVSSFLLSNNRSFPIVVKNYFLGHKIEKEWADFIESISRTVTSKRLNLFGKNESHWIKNTLMVDTLIRLRSIGIDDLRTASVYREVIFEYQKLNPRFLWALSQAQKQLDATSLAYAIVRKCLSELIVERDIECVRVYNGIGLNHLAFDTSNNLIKLTSKINWFYPYLMRAQSRPLGCPQDINQSIDDFLFAFERIKRLSDGIKIYDEFTSFFVRASYKFNLNESKCMNLRFRVLLSLLGRTPKIHLNIFYIKTILSRIESLDYSLIDRSEKEVEFVNLYKKFVE